MDFNRSRPYHEETEVFIAVFLVLPLVGIVINGILIFCIVKNPLSCFRNCSSFLVAHRAFGDGFACLLLTTHCVVINQYVATEGYMLKAQQVLILITVEGFVALFLVSLDRFLAIRYPIRYRVYIKTYVGLIIILIAIIWSVALSMALVIFFANEYWSPIKQAILLLASVLVFVKFGLHYLTFHTIKNKENVIRESLGQHRTLSWLHFTVKTSF